MAKTRRTKLPFTFQEELDELARHQAATDARLEADRQSRAAAERTRWGITDRPTPEWLLWKALQERLDDLGQRLWRHKQQLRERMEAGTVPLPDPRRGDWMDVDPFRPGPQGSLAHLARQRESAALGGAAAAQGRLAKYASPEVVRAIAADIDRASPNLSSRKRCALIKLRIHQQLGESLYPSHNFYRWLKSILGT